MDFAGRVALFVTQCNGERARLFSLPRPTGHRRRRCSFSRSVSLVFLSRRHRSEAARSLCRDIQRAMRDSRYRASRSFSRFHLPKRRPATPKRVAFGERRYPILKKKGRRTYHFLTVPPPQRSGMIYSALERLARLKKKIARLGDGERARRNPRRGEKLAAPVKKRKYQARHWASERDDGAGVEKGVVTERARQARDKRKGMTEFVTESNLRRGIRDKSRWREGKGRGRGQVRTHGGFVALDHSGRSPFSDFREWRAL